MPKIHVLEKNIAELIAAGEVIERPASVIKEIVENSIDAGAKHITVEIKNGGITYMRVTDDGCGIARDEVPTAFLRHATSKLSTAEDLECIYTMGFRGEALASISAVGRVELLTKRSEDKLGTSYKAEGGEQTEYGESGCPNGTTIIIKDLFFNTPARLKFMKKDVSEGNFVQSVVDRLALSHPEISFRFIRDNKQVSVTTGDGKCFSAVYSVFGKQFAASLTPVDYSQNCISVTGFVSTPHFCRASRAMQYFFVNTRSIRNTTCLAALEEGYRNSVMTGKFPACVLNISMPSCDVDVNVSPSKTEVRFSNEREIFTAICMAAKNAILNAENNHEVKLREPETELLPREEVMKPLEKKSSFETHISEKETKREEEPMIVNMRRLNSSKPVFTPVPPEKLYAQEKLEPNEKAFEENNPYKYISKESLIKAAEEKPKCEPAPIIEEKADKPLKFIGELFATYIICEHGDEIVLIDKHAAHERIRFEALKKELNAHAQLLAESVTCSLSAEEWNALQENQSILSDIGVEVILLEGFKAEITSLPTLLSCSSPTDTIQKLADIFMRGNENAAGEMFDDILHTFACKSAIKAHDATSVYELETLAKRVWADDNLRYCPHGRPIISTISKYTLEKSFMRIQ